MAVGGAAGARVFKETEHIQDVGCWNVTAGGLTVEFYARISDVHGTEAYLDAWDGEPYASDPVYSATGTDVEMTFGPTVTISIPLAPSGTAEITGTITPVEAIDYEGPVPRRQRPVPQLRNGDLLRVRGHAHAAR